MKLSVENQIEKETCGYFLMIFWMILNEFQIPNGICAWNVVEIK